MPKNIKGFLPILNPGKCGSSWLAHALTIRPYITFPREFDFIYFLKFSDSTQWNEETSQNPVFRKIKENHDLTIDEKLINLYKEERKNHKPNTLIIDKAPSNLYGGFIDFRHLYRNSKIICLYRDPRDIYISNEFFHQRQLDKKDHYDDIGNPNYMKENSTFRAAFDNSCKLIEIESTLHLESFEMLRVTYESMKTNFQQLLWDILSFLDLSLDSKTIVKSSYISGPIPLDDHISRALNFKPLFRKGIVGDWKNYISSRKSKAFIKERYGDLLIDLGYEKNNDW